MQTRQQARYVMLARVLLVLGAMVVALIAFAADTSSGDGGLHKDMVLSQYSPRSARAELARRVVSPLRALHLRSLAARAGTPLRAQSIELASERFAFYVPSLPPPPRGYALLVFVPPWDEAGVPREWLAVLDSHDMIYV